VPKETTILEKNISSNSHNDGGFRGLKKYSYGDSGFNLGSILVGPAVLR
jgi:hypothetical protein